MSEGVLPLSLSGDNPCGIRVSLAKPQQEMLDEMRASTTGGLWIRSYSRHDRTAGALLRKGLTRVAGTAPKHTFYVPVA